MDKKITNISVYKSHFSQNEIRVVAVKVAICY